jgi:type II secretory pathway pseudopilin PulG
MMKTTSAHRRKLSEEGYILVVVMFMLAIFILALAVAVPVVKKDIQRDREIETMHRGKQYIHAVKLYYKKFGTYPSSVDALVMTNEIRFLRKKYIDPTTGKEEWKPIYVGQNKAPTAMGFFGAPIGGAPSTGLLTPPYGSGRANNPPDSSSPPNSTDSSSPSSSAGPGTAPAAANSSDPASGGSSGTNPNTPSGGTSSGTGTGLTGPTFGGGPIMGFSPNSPKKSILVYKKKTHYNEWEFVYDPLAEQMMMQGGGNIGTVGQPASNTTTPIGTPTPTNSVPVPPAPTTPQQPQ